MKIKPLDFYKGERTKRTSAAQMGWSSAKNQSENFTQLLTLCGLSFPLKGVSVHDAGCGYGAIVPFLREAEIGGYIGTDFMSDAVRRARETHPNETFKRLDLLKDELPKVDLTLLVGTLAFHQPADATKILTKAWEASALGVGFLVWWDLDDTYVMHEESVEVQRFIQGFIEKHNVRYNVIYPEAKGDDAIFVFKK